MADGGHTLRKIPQIVNATPFPYTWPMSAMTTHSTFGESVHAAWLLFQDHFKPMLLVVLLVQLPMNLLIDLTTLRNLDWEYILRQPLEQWNPMIFLNFGLVVVASLLGMLVTISTILITQRALTHQVTTPGQALGMAVGFWPKVFITSVLNAAFLIFGILSLILPAVIFGMLFFFSTYAVVLGRRWGFGALWYSARLVINHPWFVVTRIVGGLLLVVLPVLVVAASSGGIDLYIVPAIGDTLIDVMMLFGVVYFTTLFLELEQHVLDK